MGHGDVLLYVSEYMHVVDEVPILHIVRLAWWIRSHGMVFVAICSHERFQVDLFLDVLIAL
jgi:hypothetical protein